MVPKLYHTLAPVLLWDGCIQPVEIVARHAKLQMIAAKPQLEFVTPRWAFGQKGPPAGPLVAIRYLGSNEVIDSLSFPNRIIALNAHKDVDRVARRAIQIRQPTL